MKGKIPVKDAERISYDRNCPVVIVFGIHRDGDAFSYATFGKSKALCRHAADLGKKIAEGILNGEITPAATEPTDIPNSPTRGEGRIETSK